MIEGGLEISAVSNKYIKAPAYVKVMINRISNKSLNLEIQRGKIGIFNVPEKYLEQAEDFFEDLVNNRISEVPGFSMETLEYHNGYSTFKGTFPAKVEPSPGKWID